MLDGDGTQTLLCEVESIINGKPITTATDDPKHLKILMQSHILLLKGQPNLSPGLFVNDYIYSRRQWKQAQYMADLFRRRCSREYFPFCKQGNNRLDSEETSRLLRLYWLPRNYWILGSITKVTLDSGGTEHSAQTNHEVVFV